MSLRMLWDVWLRVLKSNFKANLWKIRSCRLLISAERKVGISLYFLLYISFLCLYIYTHLCHQHCRKSAQWCHTATVINLFKYLVEKPRHTFIKFDIAEFYPSISRNLLNKSIESAKSFTKLRAIPSMRFSLQENYYFLTMTGVGEGTLFDVTMGSFDGVNICELVGFYLLDKLSNLIGRENVGLYRDDRLAAINGRSLLCLRIRDYQQPLQITSLKRVFSMYPIIW